MLDENQYQTLHQTFDKILLSSHVTKPIIANTCLHILREHPDFLKNYNHLFQPSSSYQFLKQNLSTLIRFTAISILRIFQSIGNIKYWHASYYDTKK